MVLNAIIQTILGIFGIDASSLADEFGIASSGIDTIEDGLDGITSASKEAKKSLRGFDKLNNLTTPSSSSSGSGAGVGGGIDTKLLEALKDYNLHLDEMKNKAKQIRDTILQWLGFTEDENGKLKFTNVTFGTIITSIIGVLGAIKLVKNMIKIIKGLKILSGLKKVLSFLNPVVAVIAALAGAFIYAYKTNDVFKEKVDKLIKLLSGTFMSTIKIVYNFIKTAIEYIMKLFEQLWKKILKPLWELFVELLEPIFEAFVDLLQFLFEKIIEPLLPILEDIGGKLLKNIYDQISFIINIIGDVIGILKKLFENFIKPIIDAVVDGIEKKIKPKIEGLINIVKNVKKAIENIVDFWNNLIFKDKNANLNTSYTGGGNEAYGGSGSGGFRADGGFVNSGDIFIANENNRPEYIGSFGNQTAVANTDQIVEGISIGVTRAMMNVGANKPTSVVIDAKGDASGLLDFITFEQREKNRQYGL